MVIDDGRRLSNLLSWVQLFVDVNNEAGRFVVAWSNHPGLGEADSQSPAGRTSIHHLLPPPLEELALSELAATSYELLVGGCLPRLYCATLNSSELCGSCFSTYVERDVRRLVDDP